MANNQMPHNLEAESALLGCLLIDESVQTDILESLREEDFYQESHRIILSAMKNVVFSHRTVDVVTLTDQLERDGKLERAGGLQAITDLAVNTISSANYRQYYDIVRRDSVNRALIRAARDIIENSQKGQEERESIAFAEKQVYDISQKEDGSTLQGLGEGTAVDSVIDKFDKIHVDPNAFRGLQTGFKYLDQITHGFQKGNLVVIAARPGVGKTSFAMNIVEYACLQQNHVAAVFNLEMSREELTQRLICAHGEVSMTKALSGQLEPKDWKNLYLAGDKLKKSKIYIDDSSVITPAEMLSKCRRLKSREGRLDLIMVDYIQLMNSGMNASSNEFNRQQEIAYITRSLKVMAKELGCPVLALSQLRRIQTKEAQISDLRESGAIEQDADIVMLLSRLDEDAKENVVKGAVELNIAKHRNGECKRLKLRFIGERTKFIDAFDQGEPEEPQYIKKKHDFGTSDEEPAEGDEGNLPFD